MTSPHQYQVAYDLENMNRAADYIAQKNIMVRDLDENPMRKVLKQMVAAVEKVLGAQTFAQLVTESRQGVHYLVEGQSQLVFWLEFEDAAGRGMANPALKVVSTAHRDTEAFACKTYPTSDPALDGATVSPHFYIRPGKPPLNISPFDEE